MLWQQIMKTKAVANYKSILIDWQAKIHAELWLFIDFITHVFSHILHDSVNLTFTPELLAK